MSFHRRFKSASVCDADAPPFAPLISEEALVARALHVRQRLKARQERFVTVVCHAVSLRARTSTPVDEPDHVEIPRAQGFLRHIVRAPHSQVGFLTSGLSARSSDADCHISTQMWKNVEARVYTFVEHQGSEGAEDLALLERVSPEEEQRILGGSRDVLVESY